MASKNNNNEMKREKKKKAFGLIDSIVNKMPEIHIPSYQYCGPGTNLEKRLARGDPGKNKLDVACKDHDIAYAECGDTKSRRKADKVLIQQAIKQIFSKNAKLDERAAALLVSSIMSAKIALTKIGLGLDDKTIKKKKKNRKNRRKSISFSKLVRGGRESIKKSKLISSPLDETIRAAIRSGREIKRGKTVKVPRVLKLPKFGKSLQSILPILSGLSANGSITASALGVKKAIKDIEIAKKLLMIENQQQNSSGQQNMSLEKKIGRGLNLIYNSDKNTKGSGFYLKPFQQNR